MAYGDRQWSGSTRRTEDALRVNRSFAAASGVVALGLLLASCADAPSPSAQTPSATPAQGIVLSTALDEPLRARYERALAGLGAQAVIVDAVVAGEGAVALGVPVPGADAVVTMDTDAAGRMLGRRLARCLEAVGVVSGPVLVDSTLAAGQQEISERGYEAVPGEESVGAVYAAREGDVVGVMTASASTGDEAIRVLDENAQAGKVPVVSVGADDTTVPNLDDGVLCGAVRPAFRAEARAAVDLVAVIETGDDLRNVTTQQVEVSGRTIPAVLVKPSLLTAGAAED